MFNARLYAADGSVIAVPDAWFADTLRAGSDRVALPIRARPAA